MRKILSLILVLSIISGFIPSTLVIAESSIENKADYYQERINFYEQFDTSDSQAFPDEEFFGKWDNETDSWEIESAFEYENYPELSAIEEAAKNGDYTTAKEELLVYYREKLANNNYEWSTRLTGYGYQLAAEMFMEGSFIDPSDSCMPIGRFTMTETPKWTKSDFVELLNSAVSSGSTVMDFAIHDANKDGYMARFWTKENTENQPYVQLVVNDETRTYYPTGDNTIRAGEFFKVSYSEQPYMYANESYTSINYEYSIDNPDYRVSTPDDLYGATGANRNEIAKDFRENKVFKPVDDYTMRGRIRFDFSDIEEGDTITRADLYVYGDMQPDGNPGNNPDIIKSSVDVFILSVRDTLNWSEQGHCWAKEGTDYCFSNDREYGPNLSVPLETTGYWAAKVTGGRSLGNQLCRLYRGTGNEVYAYHMIRLLKNSYLKLGDKPWIVEQPMLNRAVACEELVRQMHTLIKSPHMTAEALTMILKYFWFVADMCVYNWSSSEEANNVGTYNTSGLLSLAMFMPEFRDCHKPLDENLMDERYPGSYSGGWLAVGLKRLTYKLHTTVYEDGSSVEAPLGYIQSNLSNFSNVLSWASTMQVDDMVVEAISEEDRDLIRKSLHYVVRQTNPIFGTWQHGDDHAYTSTIATTLCKELRKFLPDVDPVIEWAATSRKNGEAPQDELSYVTDVAIKATLRSDWSQNAVAAFIDADGGNGFSHAHSDDLSIKLMAYGQFLLSDPLVTLYSGNQEYKNWQLSTRAHNTIEINNTTQRFSAGILPNGSVDGSPEPFGELLFAPSNFGKKGSLSDTRPLKEDENGNEIPGSGETLSKKRYFGNLYDYIRGETKGYINNNMMNENFEDARYILFVKPGFFIVTDHINPETDTSINTYKQSWHPYYSMPFTVDEETKNLVTNSSTTANIIIAPVDSKDEIQATIRNGMYNYTGSNNGITVEGSYVSYDKEKSGDVVYNTILYPTPAGVRKKISTAEIPLEGINEGEATAFTATIENEKVEDVSQIFYYNVLDESKKEDRKVGYYKTDALLAYAEKDTNGVHTDYILKNGTHLSIDGGIALVENGADNEITDLGIRFENNSLKIEIRDEAELDLEGAFRIYSEKPVTKVLVNDKSVYFEKVDNYIYLKETGMEQDSTSSGSNSNKPATPEHSTGGSGGGGGAASDKADKEKDEEVTDDKNEDVPPVIDTKPESITIPREFATELDGHWAKIEMTYMVNQGFVKGDGDTLNLSGKVTRAEFISVIVRALNLKTGTFQGFFDDVSDTDWYAQAMESAYNYGLLNGYNGKAEPNAPITREQMAKILVSAYEFVHGPVDAKKEIDYKDLSDISEWAEDYIAKCDAVFLMNGYEDNSFKPLTNTTRAEAFVAIYRLITK